MMLKMVEAKWQRLDNKVYRIGSKDDSSLYAEHKDFMDCEDILKDKLGVNLGINKLDIHLEYDNPHGILCQQYPIENHSSQFIALEVQRGADAIGFYENYYAKPKCMKCNSLPDARNSLQLEIGGRIKEDSALIVRELGGEVYSRQLADILKLGDYGSLKEVKSTTKNRYFEFTPNSNIRKIISQKIKVNIDGFSFGGKESKSLCGDCGLQVYSYFDGKNINYFFNKYDLKRIEGELFFSRTKFGNILFISRKYWRECVGNKKLRGVIPVRVGVLYDK